MILLMLFVLDDDDDFPFVDDGGSDVDVIGDVQFDDRVRVVRLMLVSTSYMQFFLWAETKISNKLWWSCEW